MDLNKISSIAKDMETDVREMIETAGHIHGTKVHCMCAFLYDVSAILMATKELARASTSTFAADLAFDLVAKRLESLTIHFDGHLGMSDDEAKASTEVSERILEKMMRATEAAVGAARG